MNETKLWAKIFLCHCVCVCVCVCWCFDDAFVACMHKIFMRREICNKKVFSPLALFPLFLCACNFSHSNEITNKRQKKIKRIKICPGSLLLKCSAFNFFSLQQVRFFLLRSALYQAFWHGSVHARLLAAAGEGGGVV